MNKLISALILALGLIFLTQPAFATGRLTVFIWSEYMDPAIISTFEKTHNIKVRLDYYESNEEMLAKLQSGGLGHYDIIVPSTYIIPSLLNAKLLVPLEHEKLPNIANLSPMFTDIEVDPKNEYTVPYQWGTSAMSLRNPGVENLEHSWSVIFDPQSEVGSFVLFDTARDALGSALKYLGYSLNT
ncbi:MAG: extracellular solute-binding protein, partial [Candidatus Adiutrix sp.]